MGVDHVFFYQLVFLFHPVGYILVFVCCVGGDQFEYSFIIPAFQVPGIEVWVVADGVHVCFTFGCVFICHAS